MPRDTEYMNGELPVGTMLLRDQYRIERQLIDGGFGVTYLARDSLDRRVVIKECYPAEISRREGQDVMPRVPEYAEMFNSVLRQFKCEARRLAALKHDNIVNVYQIFEENGTAYMAMEFVDGVDLFTLADIEPERFTPEIVVHALTQALEAIEYTHSQGILHRDIAPDNLLIGAKEHLTLIDFGSAFDERSDRTGAQTKLLAVKDGYSPHEFYEDDATQNASSDLYALGATFYFVITGAPPPNSQERVEAIHAGQPDPYCPLTEGRWGFAPRLLATIDKSLSLQQNDRMQSAGDWLDQLQGAEVVEEKSAPETAKSNLSEPISEEIITQLVTDTNMKLTAGMPGDLKKQREKAHAKEIQEAKPKPKQWVDIFGNPIKDVEAFLKEQDGPSYKKSLSGSGHQASLESGLVVQIPPPNLGNEQKEKRASVFGKLLGRASRSKGRSSKSAIIQT